MNIIKLLTPLIIDWNLLHRWTFSCLFDCFIDIILGHYLKVNSWQKFWTVVNILFVIAILVVPFLMFFYKRKVIRDSNNLDGITNDEPAVQQTLKRQNSSSNTSLPLKKRKLQKPEETVTSELEEKKKVNESFNIVIRETIRISEKMSDSSNWKDTTNSSKKNPRSRVPKIPLVGFPKFIFDQYSEQNEEGETK